MTWRAWTWVPYSLRQVGLWGGVSQGRIHFLGLTWIGQRCTLGQLHQANPSPSLRKRDQGKARLGPPFLARGTSVPLYSNLRRLHHSLFSALIRRDCQITELGHLSECFHFRSGFHLYSQLHLEVAYLEAHFRWELWLCPPHGRATYTADPVLLYWCSPFSEDPSSRGSRERLDSEGRRDWNFSSCSGLARFFSRLFSRSNLLFFSASSLICSFKISTSSLTAYIKWFFTRSYEEKNMRELSFHDHTKTSDF